MLIECISHSVEIFFYADQVRVETLPEDRVHGAIANLAMDLSDQEVDPLVGFAIPIALKPLEMEL